GEDGTIVIDIDIPFDKLELTSSSSSDKGNFLIRYIDVEQTVAGTNSEWIRGEGDNFTLPEYDRNEVAYNSVTVKSVDNAGNEQETNIGTVVVDRKVDKFTVSLLDDTSGSHIDSGSTDKISSNGIININDTEAGSAVYYKYDGMSEWVLIENGQTSFELPAENRKETTFTNIKVKSVDVAGNGLIKNFGDVTVDKKPDNFVFELEDDTYGGTGDDTDKVTSNGQINVDNIKDDSAWYYKYQTEEQDITSRFGTRVDEDSLDSWGTVEDDGSLTINKNDNFNGVIKAYDKDGNLSDISYKDDDDDIFGIGVSNDGQNKEVDPGEKILIEFDNLVNNGKIGLDSI
ncbi:MAG: hypothetical protein GY932_11975, partial [Arcobacter sp.]|nr:hypothetical protein [Arcobacter sp.]